MFSESRIGRTLSPVKSRFGEKGVWLLPVIAQNQTNLQQALVKLGERCDHGESLDEISLDLITEYQEHRDAPYALALIGRNRDEMRNEIALACTGIDKAFANHTTYRTPRGSVFSSEPLRDGEIAYVYPGAFNSYVGFGRELLLHFPLLHERLTDLISNVGRSLAERTLYPRCLERMTEDEKEAWALRLGRNPIAMIESGTTFSIAYTMILREIFEIRPKSAMGYSLGEISMLWSAGVWNTGDAGSDAWHASPLFKTRLFGPKDAVREAWGIQPKGDDFWSTYLLKAPEAQVRALVDHEPRVYLTIVNLPGEVVIAGEGPGCQRIIQSLGCHAIRVPFDSVIHNEVVRSEYNTFVQLYRHPIHHKPDVTFYSAAEYAPLTIEADALAHAIADMTCKPVDLPRLVETVYDSGARIFIELGPQATCSRWIDRILSTKPHVAVPINRSGMGDFHGVLTILAQLITNRIHVNLLPLTHLYQQDPPRRVVLPQNAPSVNFTTHADSGDYIIEDVAQSVQVQTKHERIINPSDSKLDGFKPGSPGDVYQKIVLPQQSQMAKTHLAFINTRHHALQNTSTVIAMQMQIAEKMLGKKRNGDRPLLREKTPRMSTVSKNLKTDSTMLSNNVMFTKDQLEEFASGNVELCFGEDYAVYRGRRLPRIPNGDLLLMSRIVSVSGTRGVFDNEPQLVAEYDTPMDAWYYGDNLNQNMPPYAVLMEIALQPCGFLSAFLGSTLATASVDYYFRNLDGRGQFLVDCDVRGKTIR